MSGLFLHRSGHLLTVVTILTQIKLTISCFNISFNKVQLTALFK
ncbi:hypothetical protein NB724_001852 [Pantoea ananatis]|jgi:hypothetical protein|uniref:Uncharacterized protein n=1 Tax=Pantoea ananas TaxID=553 RepID=A0AAJ1D0I7_PANAN|nr:hypothetical protein [Pantoea ananatis]MCW0313650.1 hypothetical protein [Pantoea ananatis]MCW0316701.1 hypothetical protein [Pantoea ananatis]MCW0332486.1 hypothetical protein [Pantoea ananatis]MCW0335098.1 hypothetical protein [Pantoea ananatis]